MGQIAANLRLRQARNETARHDRDTARDSMFEALTDEAEPRARNLRRLVSGEHWAWLLRVYTQTTRPLKRLCRAFGRPQQALRWIRVAASRERWPIANHRVSGGLL